MDSRGSDRQTQQSGIVYPRDHPHFIEQRADPLVLLQESRRINEFKQKLEKFDATFDGLIDYFAIIGFD